MTELTPTEPTGADDYEFVMCDACGLAFWFSDTFNGICIDCEARAEELALARSFGGK